MSSPSSPKPGKLRYVPPGEKRAFQDFLTRLGYASWDETGNPAYELFLR